MHICIVIPWFIFFLFLSFFFFLRKTILFFHLQYIFRTINLCVAFSINVDKKIVGPEYMVYVEERACIAHVEAGRDLYISTGSYFLFLSRRLIRLARPVVGLVGRCKICQKLGVRSLCSPSNHPQTGKIPTVTMTRVFVFASDVHVYGCGAFGVQVFHN
jgi:hypothetical protein